MPEVRREPRATVVVVEDLATSRAVIVRLLRQLGLTPVEAHSAEEALARLPDLQPDLFLLDVGLPGMSGLDLCALLRQRPQTATVPVIFLTGSSQWQDLAQAFRVGGSDYVGKPFCLDELGARVRHQLRLHRTQQELRQSLSDLALAQGAIGAAPGPEWIAHTPAMQELAAMALRLHGRPETPVLIEGETGVGKEVLARLVHHGRGGQGGPFVAVNVTALAQSLFESEVFGYEGGTFTGALQEGRAGKLEAAGAGTLFLDEIGEMPATQQPKLLRVLEERSFCRVGGNRPRPFQARLVCATNRSLWEMVNQGLFRADLFHRLNVARLWIPPLRERPDDIVPLAEHFLKAIAARRREAPKIIEAAAAARLRQLPWPGNARQLRNALEKACLLSDGPVIRAADLATECQAHPGAGAPPPGRPDSLDLCPASLPADGLDLEALVDRLHLQALDQAGGNKTRAAALLQVSRMSFRRRLDRLQHRNLARPNPPEP